MRVLYFTGSYRADSMVSHTHGDLVAALRASGVAIEMMTIAAADQRDAVAKDCDRHGTTVWRVRPDTGPFNRLQRAWGARAWSFAPFIGQVHAIRRFLSAERRNAFDLLHIGMAYPYATIVRHALRNAAEPPVIVTITGGDILTDGETDYGYGRKLSTRIAIGRTLRWATLVQANSPHTADVVQRYGCAPEQIAVQPPQSPHTALHGDELTVYRRAARQELESSGAIPPGRLMIGIGRMVGIKAYDDVIRALPAILAVQPDITVIFAGPTRDATSAAYVDSLRQLAAQLGVAERVMIRPQVPFADVPRYFAAADIALIPSLVDGLNKTGIEAASVGTPAIVSENAGLAAYVRQYQSGIVVPARTPAAIASAAIELLSSPETWRQMSEGGEHMADAFSLDRTADGVVRLYERVITARSAQSAVLYSAPNAGRVGGRSG